MPGSLLMEILENRHRHKVGTTDVLILSPVNTSLVTQCQVVPVNHRPSAHDVRASTVKLIE